VNIAEHYVAETVPFAIKIAAAGVHQQTLPQIYRTGLFTGPRCQQPYEAPDLAIEL
jgi:hypothetical protein